MTNLIESLTALMTIDSTLLQIISVWHAICCCYKYLTLKFAHSQLRGWKLKLSTY